MSDLGLTTNCLRCGTRCRRGAPDPQARAIVQAADQGFCPNCMITFFFLTIEPVRDTIAARGPEIFLDAKWRENALRPVLRGLLAHTQLPDDSIHWIEVVGNWGLPWPKGRQPKVTS